MNQQRIAILAEHGFEESELKEPQQALKEAGFEVDIVSPQEKKIKSWAKTDWGPEYDVDKSLSNANASDYVALVLPGGLMNPDELRKNETALDFIQSFISQNKIIAAICHAAWSLTETDFLRDKKMTSIDSIKTDLKNAGAHWVDEEVVLDGNLITSRSPKDLKAFNNAIITALKKDELV